MDIFSHAEEEGVRSKEKIKKIEIKTYNLECWIFW